MPRRSTNWFDDDGNLSMSILVKNNPHDTRVMSIFTKIRAINASDRDKTKTDVLMDALHVWAGLELPASENELLNTLIEMVGSIHSRLDDLQADIDQLAAQGVNVQGIQSRANQLRQTADAPQALSGMFSRFNRENE